MRRTYTDIEDAAEHDVEDLWTDEGSRPLSESWRGKTVFTILRPRAPPGYEWVVGRLTKCQKTSRPGHLWPEIWSAMGKKPQKIEIAKWEALQPKLKAARDKRGIWEIPEDDKDYLKIVSELRAKQSVPAAPAMPLFQTVMAAPLGAKGDLHPKNKNVTHRQHQDKVANKRTIS